MSELSPREAYHVTWHGVSSHELEAIIARDSEFSYKYAKNVIKGRWRPGEDAICQHSTYSFLYARNILRSPFKRGESSIATDATNSYNYAREILKARFPLGESSIASDAYCALYYAANVIGGEFALGENSIANDFRYGYFYAVHVIKSRFKQWEELIDRYFYSYNELMLAINYEYRFNITLPCMDVNRSLIPPAYRLCHLIKKNERDPKLEEGLRKYPRIWKRYREHFNF